MNRNYPYCLKNKQRNFGNSGAAVRQREAKTPRYSLPVTTENCHGLQGSTVVRLKGGCPSVFSRLHSELAALSGAGVAVEIVPGVSSVLAAPLAAGENLQSQPHAPAVPVLTWHIMFATMHARHVALIIMCCQSVGVWHHSCGFYVYTAWTLPWLLSFFHSWTSPEVHSQASCREVSFAVGVPHVAPQAPAS